MIRVLVSRLATALTITSLAGVGLAQVVGLVLPGGDEMMFSSASGWRSGQWEVQVLDMNRGVIASLAMSSAGSNPGLPVVWSPDGSQIAYVSDSSAHAETYLIDADGGERRLLNPVPDQDTYSAIWSPDGSRIAFISGYYIYVADGDGQNARQVVWHADEYDYVLWSPDSRLLAVQASDYQLYTLDLAAGHFRHIAPQLQNSLRPAWSPDGQKIAFLGRSPDDPRTPVSAQAYGGGPNYLYPPAVSDLNLYIANPDGSERRQLTDGQVASSRWRVRWSPDAKHLLVGSWAWSGGETILRVDVADSSVVKLTDKDDADARPAWSPDGRRIAFTSRQEGFWQVYIMDIDGSHRQQITQGRVDHRSPIWSPDGRSLVFSANEGTEWDLFLFDLDTNTLRRLTTRSGIEFAPSWRPEPDG